MPKQGRRYNNKFKKTSSKTKRRVAWIDDFTDVPGLPTAGTVILRRTGPIMR